MSSFVLSLLLLSLLALSISVSESQPDGTFIDCGATASTTVGAIVWEPDGDYVSSGKPIGLLNSELLPYLSTVRSFPNLLNRKFCYVVPVYRQVKYMVRTTYYYYGNDTPPPVFDQIVDGTFWSVVNTTADYAEGKASYYEGVFVPTTKSMSVCVAANANTESEPFISALEIVRLADSVYNSTNFSVNGLSLAARHSFGYNGSIIRYPDDQFDRFWQPFADANFTVASTKNLSVSGFWNLPPAIVFETEKASSPPQPLELQWPPGSLAHGSYYIALYFADGRGSISSSRMFNISINSVSYYANLHAIPAGSVVYSTNWTLGGVTNITLTPAPESDVGPLINAGEVFSVLPLGKKTLTRDVTALENLKRSFSVYPSDWSGDPCMPHGYSWTGITCSEGGSRIRVIALNLTGMGVSGSLSSRIANLTALTSILLGSNNLTGSIPDISLLKQLEILHLDNNQFSGQIPQSLSGMNNLREIFLQNNNLSGQIPIGLVGKQGLNFVTSPGNNLSAPPPS